MAVASLPRGPKGKPFIGNLRDFQGDQLTFLTNCAREYGDFVPLRFGPARVVLINHPDYIEQLLVVHNRSFIKSRAIRALRPVIGNGLLINEHESWLRQRRLMQPAFHRQRLAGYAETMVTYTERTLADWKDGEIRSIPESTAALTLEIAAKTLFDADVRHDAAEVGAAVTEGFDALSARLASLLLLLPDSLPAPVNIRMRRATRRLDAIVYRIIAERRAQGEDRGDLLSMLLQAQDEDDGSRMTDRQVRDEAMTIFIAGHETTANLLCWALYLIGGHPEVEAKLLRELDTVLGGRLPTLADLPQLSYTEQVISETLRLYPPAPAIGREATEPVEIGGYPIAKGTAVVAAPWIMQRDARYFDEPDAFQPERWADGLAQRLPKAAYFPFGLGQRMCIGAQFANMEAALILATIFQRFHFQLAQSEPVIPYISPTLRAKYGLKMRITRR